MSVQHKLNLRILEGTRMARCFIRRLKTGCVVGFDRIGPSKKEFSRFIPDLNRYAVAEGNSNNNRGGRLISIARILDKRKCLAGPAGLSNQRMMRITG